jgi:hypothetical protein
LGRPLGERWSSDEAGDACPVLAVGVILATPAAGHAQGDPASVARDLIEAENRHDVEAAVALQCRFVTLCWPVARILHTSSIHRGAARQIERVGHVDVADVGWVFPKLVRQRARRIGPSPKVVSFL